MNSRLTCRLVRLWRAVTDSPNPSHQNTCPDCQAHARRIATLDTTLRADAAAARVHPAPSLERDILSSVRDATRRDVRRPDSARPSLAWRSLVTTAAAAVIALGVFAVNRTTAPVALTRADAVALINSVTGVSDRIANEVIPTAGTIIADNPLQSEMNAVYADARAAVDFLALNFLPSQAVASNQPR